MNQLRITDPFSIEPFENFLRGLPRPWSADLGERAPQIKLDVHESDGNYVVKAEIPGVRKEDIDVRVDGDLVTISAEVKKDKEEKAQGRLIRSERQYGFASRSFTLGCEVDQSKSAAKYQDGVLELTLPKRPATSSKRLEIS